MHTSAVLIFAILVLIRRAIWLDPSVFPLLSTPYPRFIQEPAPWSATSLQIAVHLKCVTLYDLSPSSAQLLALQNPAAKISFSCGGVIRSLT
ncbi:hypothetical protein FPQ18DRAFT_345987 [Pyronema domesticum]|nr:hypothetical protein FPQ18DRAFT_345987 [Pyronema domesticum]